MGFHAKVPGFAGGYTGVDIFFVISGYLITLIIWREADAGTFRLAHFYERRARRILPALGCVLLVCVLVALLVPDLDFAEGFGSQLFASLLFSGNIYLWRQPHGYFAEPEDTNPLIHLWSLGVEEQFYILFPLAMLLFRRFGRRWVFALLAAGAAASLGLSIWLTGVHQGANFYLLPSRAWELAAGGLLALAEPRVRHAAVRYPAGAQLLAAAGLAAVCVPVLLYDASTPFPGITAVPTVLGAVLLVGFAREGGVVARLLSLRAFVAIGLVSYSAYLWHQPLLAFARLLSPDAVGLAASLVLLVVALLLAGVSWQWIELPFRRSIGGRQALVWAIVVNAALAAAAILFWATGGLPQRFAPENRALAGELHREYTGRQTQCYFVPGEQRAFADACRIGAADGIERGAIIGDSHAIALAPAFSEGLTRSGARALLFSRAGCAPILPVGGLDPIHAACADFYSGVTAELLRRREIGTVIVAARWTYDLERTFYDNGEGGNEGRSGEPVTPAAARPAVLAGYQSLVRTLLGAGKRVVLVYPVPEAGWRVPRALAQIRMFGWGHAEPLTTSRARYEERQAVVRAALDALGERPGLIRLDPAPHLCPPGAGGRCLLQAERQPLYFDDDHLTGQGARFALPEAGDPRLFQSATAETNSPSG